MKLIPVQIRELKQMVKRLEKQTDELIVSKSFKPALFGSNEESGLDRDIIDQIARNNATIMKIKMSLDSAEVVKAEDIATDHADIGTSFKVVMNTPSGREKIVEGTLIETNIAGEGVHTLYTITSPFGQALYGKEAGDEFSYTIERTGRKMNGKVLALTNSMAESMTEEKGAVKVK